MTLSSGRWINRGFHFALGLDGHSDIFRQPQRFAAVAVADTAERGEQYTGISLVELAAAGSGSFPTGLFS